VSCIWDGIERFSALISSSAILTFITGVYALLTFLMLLESRKTRLWQTQPRVTIYIKPEDEFNMMDLVVENLGAGPALNIRLTLKHEFEVDGDKLSEMGMFKNGIAFLPPSGKIQTYIASMFEPGAIDQTFEIHAEYSDSSGKSYNHNFQLGFGQYKGTISNGRPALTKLAEELERIRKALEKIE
jgi:hypothetical protein